MLLRILIGSLLAAIVLMVWGAVIWVVSPVPHLLLRGVPNEDAVAKTLNEQIPESGVYLFPWWTEVEGSPEAQQAAMDTVMEKHRRGPIGQIIFRKEGLDPMQPAGFVLGFAHFFVSALIMSVLLVLALPGLHCYGSRLLFVFLAGLFAGWTVQLSDVIWFHHPPEYRLFLAGLDVTNWLLAGAVLAAVVRPRGTAGAACC
jgi:hypothetical protein